MVTQLAREACAYLTATGQAADRQTARARTASGATARSVSTASVRRSCGEAWRG
jgi:hypothetical protein